MCPCSEGQQRSSHDPTRGRTWELFIDVFVDQLRLSYIFYGSNIVVHFLVLLFIFWDDARHIYKQEELHLTKTLDLYTVVKGNCEIF